MRVGLLGLFLVLVLGSGAVAQEPSEAPFAPDDLAFTIPSRVGDYELDIVARDDIDPANKDMWRDLLLPLGKEPADLRQVTSKAYPIGQASDESAEYAFNLDAMRVDGVLARDYTERLMDVVLEAFGTGSAMFQRDWRVIDAREVYCGTVAPPEVLVEVAIEMAAEQGIELTEQELADIRAYEAPNPDAGVHLYPSGEVLYSIIVPWAEAADDMPTLAEILAELP